MPTQLLEIPIYDNTSTRIFEATQSLKNEDFRSLRAVLKIVATLWPLRNIASSVNCNEHAIVWWCWWEQIWSNSRTIASLVSKSPQILASLVLKFSNLCSSLVLIKVCISQLKLPCSEMKSHRDNKINSPHKSHYTKQRWEFCKPSYKSQCIKSCVSVPGLSCCWHNWRGLRGACK